MEHGKEIDRLSNPATHPDGRSYRSLSLESVSNVSARCKMYGRDVEIAALETGVVPERYSRNMGTYSLKQQAALLKSCVSVVGLGGLGGVVVEVLARMGVGTLRLIDGDTFEESNLNRQFLSTERGLRETKVGAAVARIKAINSSIEALAYPEYMNEENAVELIDKSDVIIDCLGGIKDRFVLAKASRKVGCPLVSGAIAGLAGQVTTIFPEDKGLEQVYGEPDTLPATGVEASLGCLPQIATLVATLECSEAAKILLNHEVLFRNRILIIDLQENVFEVFQLD